MEYLVKVPQGLAVRSQIANYNKLQHFGRCVNYFGQIIFIPLTVFIVYISYRGWEFDPAPFLVIGSLFTVVYALHAVYMHDVSLKKTESFSYLIRIEDEKYSTSYQQGWMDSHWTDIKSLLEKDDHFELILHNGRVSLLPKDKELMDLYKFALNKIGPKKF